MSFEDKIYKTYRRLFKKSVYIECSCGWNNLIEEFIKELYEVSKQFKRNAIKVTDIKEKFGGMRCYVEYKLPDEQIVEIEQIVGKYEKHSHYVCCSCGSEEHVTPAKRYWELPYCQNCLNTPTDTKNGI